MHGGLSWPLIVCWAAFISGYSHEGLAKCIDSLLLIPEVWTPPALPTQCKGRRERDGGREGEGYG